MEYVEFHLERQGRPDVKATLDMETRAPSIPAESASGVVLTATYSQDEITNSYTASDITVILVDALANEVIITLPAAVSSAGRYYYIKKLDAGTNAVVIKPDDRAELIDGEEELRLKLQYGFVQVVCSGTEAGDSYWHIIGGVSVKIEQLLEDLLQEQISLLAQLVSETQQSKLHLAGISGEPVDETDTEIW